MKDFEQKIIDGINEYLDIAESCFTENEEKFLTDSLCVQERMVKHFWDVRKNECILLDSLMAIDEHYPWEVTEKLIKFKDQKDNLDLRSELKESVPEGLLKALERLGEFSNRLAIAYATALREELRKDPSLNVSHIEEGFIEALKQLGGFDDIIDRVNASKNN